MQAASLSTDHFNDILNLLPIGLDLDRQTFDYKAIERCREASNGASLLHQ
jgi:hypothetical protein